MYRFWETLRPVCENELMCHATNCPVWAGVLSMSQLRQSRILSQIILGLTVLGVR